MLIDVSQTAYLSVLADIAHTDAVVQRALHWLQENMPRSVHMSDHPVELVVSERRLMRRFNAVLDQSPLTVDQIALQVGFEDASSFSRLFRRRMGLSSGAYRSRSHRRGQSDASECLTVRRYASRSSGLITASSSASSSRSRS